MFVYLQTEIETIMKIIANISMPTLASLNMATVVPMGCQYVRFIQGSDSNKSIAPTCNWIEN